ncbi:GNAT family N-acetyltransferase [Glutamicibacter arilaitensis]|uniref:GNAT family N-acetyltransferase n=1 Tax=Glutamicibacter arilaitensis TaxID=256701 RepID=UPI00384AF716
MSITFAAMDESDTEEVISFLVSNPFPFHVHPAPVDQDVREKIAKGRYWNEDTQGYWISENGRRIGMVSLEDLQEDNSPMFDLRLSENQRGRGRGVKVLRALCDLVFETMPQVLRFEGQTREDNIAMRKTFLQAGFVKEAHYRMGWPTADGRYLASIAYSILSQDWKNNTVTAFEWDDLPM